MTHDESTADTIRRLLMKFEGVSVERLKVRASGSASVTLRIAHPATIARFACWAQNANVAFHIWGESWGRSEEEWASPDRVRYELRADGNGVIDSEHRSDRYPNSIDMFCAHMVHDLADRGCLDSVEANRLLDGWGLRQRGAQLDAEN